MNTEYENLDLDGLLELARSDAEHAGDMAEQARVLREMSSDLRDTVDLMRGVMTTLFGEPGDPDSGVWSGDSSRMMKVELDRLFTVAEHAPEVFDGNARSMDGFSTKVTETLITIDQLHVQSKGHGTDLAAEDSDVRAAREFTQTANTDYLGSAKAMGVPEFYNGLREPASGSSDDWAADHGATQAPPSGTPDVTPAPVEPSRPQDGTPPNGPESTPILQGPAPTAAPPPIPGSPPVAPGSVLPGPPFVAPGPMAPGPFLPLPVGAHKPVLRPNPLNPGSPGGFPPPRPGPTVPPVIGTRPDPVGPTPGGRPVPPVPGGTVRPVIGSRPGSVIPPVVRPVSSSPDGTVRPVIGSRPRAGYPYPAGQPANGRATGARPANVRLPVAPPVLGTDDFLSSRHQAARPAGSLAFGAIARPAAARPTGVPATSEPKSGHGKAPGQRVKRTPRQGGAAVEGAIRRGTRTRRSPGKPTQDVFAASDVAASRQDQTAATAGPADPESNWDIRQVTVPAVISPRKEN